MSKHNRIPGGLSRVCCGARARRRVRVARWRRVVVGGCRLPVPPVVASPVPRYPFGCRRFPFYAVVTVALAAQAVWWFAPVRVASVAGAVLGLLAGWVLVTQFLFPRGVS